MVTSLSITQAFLDSLEAKILASTTADETSNLLNQYVTLTDLIRNGYQFSDAQLLDLPATIRAEVQVQIDSALLDMNLINRGYKNHIVGGNFATNPFQLGISGICTTSESYTADGFVIASGTVGLTWSQNLVTRGFVVGGVAGNTKSYIYHKIESRDILDCVGDTNTWSIRVYDSVGGRTVKMVLDIPSVTDNFSSCPYNSHSEHVLNLGWNTITFTKLLSADAKRGLRLQLEITNGLTSGYLEFDYWQFERGLYATKKQHVSASQSMNECRRYKRKYFTQQNVNDLGLEMRTVPSEIGSNPYIYTSEF